jgi:hypothetical protein
VFPFDQAELAEELERVADRALGHLGGFGDLGLRPPGLAVDVGAVGEEL